MPLEKQLYYKNNGGALSIFIVNAADKIFAYETNVVYIFIPFKEVCLGISSCL